MELNCQRFLLLFLLLHCVLGQEEGKAISSGFKNSIDKFIEKIAILKKNMKKLAEEREKLNSKTKQSDESIESEGDSGIEDETFDFDYDDEEDEENISVDLGIEEDFDYEEETEKEFDYEEETDLSQEVDDIEDSLKTESSFLDKLLFRLSKKDNRKSNKKSKINDFISREKNLDFLDGLKQKSKRVKVEQNRLSGFLNRFRNSQANLNRPRFRQDPLSNFRDILGVDSDFRSTNIRGNPLDLIEENRNLLREANRNSFHEEERSLFREDERQGSFSGKSNPSLNINKAFKLLDGIPRGKSAGGNVFVFTFADSHNPVLVFDS
eukprot:GFUD01073439.1.p1 GENE.GFUD01073439.1~~GFUD01073439.1.p1  ORF type:complete len:323 (-),score=92.81 GFUD01073439.1:38-1006(-)